MLLFLSSNLFLRIEKNIMYHFINKFPLASAETRDFFSQRFVPKFNKLTCVSSPQGNPMSMESLQLFSFHPIFGNFMFYF